MLDSLLNIFNCIPSRLLTAFLLFKEDMLIWKNYIPFAFLFFKNIFWGNTSTVKSVIQNNGEEGR